MVDCCPTLYSHKHQQQLFFALYWSKDLFQINAVLLNFLFIFESWKIQCYSFHKNIEQHNCFNIDNNQKCFLSSKSVYSNDAENTALITAINCILQYIPTENRYFNITILFTVFDQINAALVSKIDFLLKA